MGQGRHTLRSISDPVYLKFIFILIYTYCYALTAVLNGRTILYVLPFYWFLKIVYFFYLNALNTCQCKQ